MGIKRISGALPQLSKGFEKALAKELDGAVSDGISDMKARIQKGKDVNLRPFKKYSEQYRKRKKARGRKTSPPDLTFSGKMLGSITYKRIGGGATQVREVFFASAEEAKKAAGNIKTRDFFGFDKKITKKLQTTINNKIRELLKK